MKIEYHKNKDFSNKIYKALVTEPGRLSYYLDITHADALPADTSPWAATEIERSKVVDILKQQNVDSKLVDDLSKDNCLVVMAGQQPGLMGGPLYCLYKALTAVKLAEKLSKRHSVPVVPVFCNLSDDGDWGEANRFTYWNQGKWQNTKIKKEIEGAHLFDKSYADNCRDLFEELGIENKEFISQFITFEKEDNWGGFQSRLMNNFFKDLGLLVIEQKWFRPLQADFLKMVVEKHLMIEQNIMMASSALSLSSFETSLEINQGHHLCFAKNSRRERLLEKEGIFSGRHHEIGSLETLNKLITDQPEMFSCNVVSRPLWMRHLFPVVSEIVGPGETAYQIQLQGIYKNLQIAAPVLTPRMSVTLLRQREKKRLDKLNKKPWEIVEGHTVELDPILKEAINDRLGGIEQLWLRLSDQITTAYPEINDKISKEGKRLNRDLKRVPEMVKRAQVQREEEAQIQHQALLDWIKPLSKPQERILSFASVQMMGGEDWWLDFRMQVDALNAEHVWVTLDF